MVKINTSELESNKQYEVEIGDESKGFHTFLLRKPGAGEQLELFRSMDRVQKLSAKETLTDKEEAEMLKLSDGLLKQMYSLFDDRDGGKKIKQILYPLSADTLSEIVRTVTNEEAA